MSNGEVVEKAEKPLGKELQEEKPKKKEGKGSKSADESPPPVSVFTLVKEHSVYTFPVALGRRTCVWIPSCA